MSKNDASYVEFVTAHQSQLRRIAYAVCRDDSRAEDVLQEALVKLYLSWGSVRGAGREEAYARRIIVNADLDQRRRPWHRRRAILPVEHYDRPVPNRLGVEERTDVLAALRGLAGDAAPGGGPALLARDERRRDRSRAQHPRRHREEARFPRSGVTARGARGPPRHSLTEPPPGGGL